MPEASVAKSTPEHRTVTRVMAILEAVVAHEPNGVRLADLADLINAPKSSIHGLTKGLVTTGYLRERDSRYYLGAATSLLTSTRTQYPAAYHHALEQLSAEWNETAVLSTLAGDNFINIDVVEPAGQMVRALPPMHSRRPMWPTSYGKAFLAFMPDRQRESYLSRKHPDREERALILAELDDVRASRIAYNRGEVFPEYSGAASPILVPNGEATFAIGVAGLTSRISNRLEDVGASVRQAAQQLSAGHQLSGTAPGE